MGYCTYNGRFYASFVIADYELVKQQELEYMRLLKNYENIWG